MLTGLNLICGGFAGGLYYLLITSLRSYPLALEPFVICILLGIFGSVLPGLLSLIFPFLLALFFHGWIIFVIILVAICFMHDHFWRAFWIGYLAHLLSDVLAPPRVRLVYVRVKRKRRRRRR